ncbi:RHS repeat-associated core domain-containing protein [Spartinivicinus marinus]|uniref:RHS repeat-associated core domain-containing protein n=1 Tax=Spartinivicinus marinus TaxID=2994442 RepID=UPI001C5CA8C0|nr:RHS repeat-associated core domain-containing protein [Spartinivicinus marinus]
MKLPNPFFNQTLPSTSPEKLPNLSRRGFLIKSSLFVTSASLLTTSIPVHGALTLSSNHERPTLIILQNPIGFTGEQYDSIAQVYHLGNGYRLYNPRLMRFHSIDSLSPFNEGGFNGYSYCLNDPINLVDPTGHISWQAGVSIGLGVLALVIGVVTLGAGIAASAGLMTGAAAISTAAALKAGLAVTSGVTGIISGGLGIASGAIEEINPTASTQLGYAALAFGITSAATGIGSLIAGARVTANASSQLIRSPLNPSLIASPKSGQVTLKLTDSIAHYNPRFVAKSLHRVFHGSEPFQRIAITGDKAPALFRGTNFLANSYAQQLSNQTGKQVIELARRGSAAIPQSRRASSVPSIINASTAITKSPMWTPARLFGLSRVIYSSGMIGRSVLAT